MKLTVEIYLPAALQCYDVKIPADLQLADVTTLVAKAFSQIAKGLYIADDSSILCERESGKILNINMTPWELGLRNGFKLMLI